MTVVEVAVRRAVVGGNDVIGLIEVVSAGCMLVTVNVAYAVGVAAVAVGTRSLVQHRCRVVRCCWCEVVGWRQC